jgi:amino acid transporter
VRAGTGLTASLPVPPVPAPPSAGRTPISPAAFLGVSVASLGGPLALAALYAPTIVSDTTPSAGLVSIAGAVVFAVPLLVWLRYGRQVAGAGGLYDFVAAAAGRRTALVHAALWIFSYTLYLVYTTAAIVYDTLPVVLPGVRPYQALLEVGIPVVLAAIMLAGRSVALAAIGVLAAGQLVLVAALAAVSIGHDAPVSSFALPASGTGLSSATGQIALLYVCGSLPLYLGGELARPRRTIRRGLTAGYLLTAAGVTAAVFPVAANPAFTRAPIPGMAMAQVFGGHAFAVAVGVGVAASTAGVMLVEYLALSRLVHALTARPVRHVVAAGAVVLVATAPVTLIDPDRIYDDLLKPSLAALWLSQLIVFAVYPRFAARTGRLRVSELGLAGGAALFALYGLYMTFYAAGT